MDHQVILMIVLTANQATPLPVFLQSEAEVVNQSSFILSQGGIILMAEYNLGVGCRGK